jgi:hypothetical protein
LKSLILLASFSKDPLQPGPRLKFQVPGSVNTLSCCVKSNVTPPLADLNAPTNPPQSPHAHHLPMSLVQQQAAAQLQGSVTISTISLLNDVKIAVDPSFKLTRFDPIFTRKFLQESMKL